MYLDQAITSHRAKNGRNDHNSWEDVSEILPFYLLSREESIIISHGSLDIFLVKKPKKLC